MNNRPIADYALLSDSHSAALVSGDGSVDWLCLPRFDSPSVFGRLLGAEAGHWSIRPDGDFETRRQYVGPSLVLETQFETRTGMAMLVDALAFDDHERGHDIGGDAPHVLMRVLTVTEGRMSVRVEFVPRPEYGIVHPLLSPVNGGLIGRGGTSTWLLSGPLPDEGGIDSAAWTIELEAGDDVAFALHRADRDVSPEPWSAKQIRKRLDDTETAWRSWSELHQNYEGPWQDLVHHSGRVLRGLTHQPTGAIVAAPTTSLPEKLAGTRNWDYRYCWLRDASLTLRALWVAACPVEAGQFLQWIISTAGAALLGRERLQIMYGIGGEHDLAERELAHLPGWCDSRPVRVGNAAWEQHQIDIYGEVLDAVHLLRDLIGEPDELTSAFLVALADAAVADWRRPDHGIWEVRGEPQHFLYSKLMCWVALDRAVDMADWMGAGDRREGWASEREKIREEILSRGWSDQADAYTGAFDSPHLDASVLMIPITGFCAADEPRMRSTIDRVAEELSAPCGLIVRYQHDDGLPGDEGAFLLCTYWLAECLALAGDIEKAHETFDRVTAYANDVGLLSEEAEPLTGQLLGNFPQAFSHIGLVNAAWTISSVEVAALSAQSSEAKQ